MLAGGTTFLPRSVSSPSTTVQGDSTGLEGPKYSREAGKRIRSLSARRPLSLTAGEFLHFGATPVKDGASMAHGPLAECIPTTICAPWTIDFMEVVRHDRSDRQAAAHLSCLAEKGSGVDLRYHTVEDSRWGHANSHPPICFL